LEDGGERYPKEQEGTDRDQQTVSYSTRGEVGERVIRLRYLPKRRRKPDRRRTKSEAERVKDDERLFALLRASSKQSGGGGMEKKESLLP